MKRYDLMKSLESEIKAEMCRIYTEFCNLYSTIYVLADGTMETKVSTSENSWFEFEQESYPVFTLNPAKQFDESERDQVTQTDLDIWAEVEFADALRWAKAEDINEEEERLYE